MKKQRKRRNIQADFLKSMFEAWADHKNVGLVFKDEWFEDKSFTAVIFDNGNAVSKRFKYDEKYAPGRIEAILNRMLKEIRDTNE